MRLEPLLAALRELFGPRLSFGEVADEQLPVLWDGVEESSAWLGGAPDAPYPLASRLLDAAHTAALEGMGRRGEHPGAWATASPEVGREGTDIVLSLEGPEGRLASVSFPD